MLKFLYQWWRTELRLSQKELMIGFFFMGSFAYLVFMVQPHGSDRFSKSTN